MQPLAQSVGSECGQSKPSVANLWWRTNQRRLFGPDVFTGARPKWQVFKFSKLMVRWYNSAKLSDVPPEAAYYCS